MKRRIIVLLLAICMVTASACGGKISTGNKALADAVYSDDSISLAAYTGLKAEKKVYKVTDEDVDNAVKEELSEYADMKSVSRVSRDGDWVYVDYTASVDGRTVSEEEDYYFVLGEEEYGAEFDEKLTGAAAGDELAFTLAYEDDFDFDEFAGKTIDFEVSVTKVEEEILPEPTDKFVKKKFGYNTYEEFVEGIRASTADEYEDESISGLQEDLLQQVIDASSILQYTKEEYEEAEESINSIYQSYADMFGSNLESVYDMFEVTEEDVEKEVMDALYRTIVVNAIIENEQLTLSDEEYEEGVARYMKENDYDLREEFLEDYGEEEVRRQLLEDKVLELLADTADITEVEAVHDED